MSRLIAAVVLATMSILCLGGVASAADMSLKAPPPAAAPAWSWAGWYAGINVGYGAGDASVTEQSSSPAAGFALLSNTTHMSVGGVIGGGQIGYNWQTAPNWLVGLEADFQGSGQRHTDTFSSGFPPGTSVVDTVGVDVDWFGTVRGRLGYIADNTNLWYVTGGYAYGRTELHLTSTNSIGIPPPFNAAAGSFDKTASGWTLGGGLESHLVGHWTGKIEYLYVDLGTISGAAGTTPLGAPAPTTLISASAHVHDNIMRAGLNYKF